MPLTPKPEPAMSVQELEQNRSLKSGVLQITALAIRSHGRQLWHKDHSIHSELS